MMFGKALRVFAATLVFTSSISFATGEGTGSNPPPSAPTEGAQSIHPLVLSTGEITNIRPDGTTEVLSVGSTTTFTEEESTEAQELVETEIRKNIQEGGHPSLLALNPDGVMREWATETAATAPTNAVIINERQLPKTWNDRSNGILEKALNQFRVDPDYSERVKEFGAAYLNDIKTFYSKNGEGLNKFNINISLIKMAANSGAPCLLIVLSHGFHNIAPQVAFLPYLLAAMTSGVVFTYLKTFIPWNKELPKPSDTTFWKGAELGIIGVLYQVTEVGFLGLFGLGQYISNKWALHRGETPQFKVMTYSENAGIPNGVAFKSSLGQEPLDVSFGHIYKMGMKEQDALLKAHPEMADQVQAARKKLNNYLGARNVVVSVLINLVGLVAAPHSYVSKIGFILMYSAATVAVGKAFAPGKFQEFVNSAQNYFFPKPTSLNESIIEQCGHDLSLLSAK